MAIYSLTAQNRKAYLEQSRGYVAEPEPRPQNYWVDLPEPLDSYSLKMDIATLSAYATDTVQTQSGSLSERIFGPQLGKAKTNARHVGHLLSERWRLYCLHLEEIGELTSDLKGRLDMLRRPYHLHPPQLALGLERMLIQLQGQEREERLAFWKDSAELRDRLLESATEYGAVRSRASLLSPGEAYTDG
jgi:hypothetical protein